LENNESQLIANFINGKEAAFDAIFKTYYKPLCLFAMKVVKDKESAEEIVQDLFVNFWEKRQSFQIKWSLKSYLYRAVYNNSIHSVEKRKRFVSDQNMVENDHEFIDFMEETEMEQKIYQSIEKLPPTCKEIFNLSRFDELKYSEIANRLNISIKTVETQISRALRFLEVQLADLLLIVIISKLFH
jgi:RNA polymerase sigma-70 factor (ECF subfamily)